MTARIGGPTGSPCPRSSRALGLVLSCGLMFGLMVGPMVGGMVGGMVVPASSAAEPAPAPVLAAPAEVITSRAAPTADGESTTTAPRKVLKRLLSVVNAVRAVPQRCGDDRMPPVGPVSTSKRLHRAAQNYARTMARRDWFDHQDPGGADPGDRISAAGYRWSRWGENIAAGYEGALETVTAWLASPGHCRTLMSSYRHVGLGYAFDARSTYGHYWVQDFATPR